MKLKDKITKIYSYLKSPVTSATYAPKIADVYEKNNHIYVALQFFSSNTFVRKELGALIEDEDLLVQLSVHDVKLLFQAYYESIDSRIVKVLISHDPEGIYLYNRNNKTFYSIEEVARLIEDEELIASLQPESAYLLGKYVSENKVRKQGRPDLFLLSERISHSMGQLQSQNMSPESHNHH